MSGTYFGGRPDGLKGSDCDNFTVRFSFFALFRAPVALLYKLDNNPEF
jgi:hypothetical protein